MFLGSPDGETVTVGGTVLIAPVVTGPSDAVHAVSEPATLVDVTAAVRYLPTIVVSTVRLAPSKFDGEQLDGAIKV